MVLCHDVARAEPPSGSAFLPASLECPVGPEIDAVHEGSMPSPLMADRGRYFIRITFEQLPSPLTGEGAGGGEDSVPSLYPDLPPPRGEGVLTSPWSPLMGEG
jgi:hypothetical protein